MNRETWLGLMAEKMAPRFAELGHPLPAVRMAVGFPSAGSRGRAIGECWSAVASADKTHEILIRPDQADARYVAAVLAHELAHAAVGLKEGHTGKFAKVVLALGLKRPLTVTTPGPAFDAWVKPLLDEVGPLPHAKLSWINPAPKLRREPGDASVAGGDSVDEGITSSGPPKQSTRMHKAECATCGYTVRVAKKWLDVGAPHCPVHGVMVADPKATEV